MDFQINSVQDCHSVQSLIELLQSRIIIHAELNPEFVEQYILSDWWPQAVPQSAIIQTLESSKQRAESIIDKYIGDLTGKRFLDYGCGNGDCVLQAQLKANFAIGYDITQHESWNNQLGLTTDYSQLVSNKPYDIILMYDVFDHLSKDNAISVMKMVQNLCHPRTIVKVRCHPWTAIHGGHTYEKLNKAFAHLFLTDEQLPKYQSSEVRKLIRPLPIYQSAWTAAGFDIKSTDIVRANWDPTVSSFFSDKSLLKYVNKLREGVWNQQTLSISFVDYTLARK